MSFRISNTGASKAFAIATSGSSSCEAATIDPAVIPQVQTHKIDRLNSIGSTTQKSNDWVIVNTAASMRVLNVLRHWVTKHFSVRKLFLVLIYFYFQLKFLVS